MIFVLEAIRWSLLFDSNREHINVDFLVNLKPLRLLPLVVFVGEHREFRGHEGAVVVHDIVKLFGPASYLLTLRHLGDPEALLVYAAAIFVDHDGPPEYGRGPVNLDGALLVGVVAYLLQAGEKRLAIVEQLVELEGELNFHLVYVVDGKTQEVADGERLARELVVVVLILQFLVPEVGPRGRRLIVALRPVDV